MVVMGGKKRAYHVSVFLLVVCLCLPVVLSYQTWFQTANAGLNFGGGNGFIAYASNRNNLFPNSTYKECQLEGSNRQPVALDWDNDTQTEIAIFTDTYIRVYNQDCELEGEWLSNKEINDVVVFSGAESLNGTGDSFLELIALTNETILILQYNETTQSLQEYGIIDYYNQTGRNREEQITCNRNFPQLCWTRKQLSTVHKDTLRINLTGRNASIYTAVTTAPFAQTAGNTNRLLSSSPIQFNSDTYYMSICDGRDSPNIQVRCSVFDNSGTNVFTTTNVGSASGAIIGYDHSEMFMARVGSVFRFFLNENLRKTGVSEHISTVLSLTGTTIFNPDSTFIFNRTSNWMVGDFNKDGDNEACIMQQFSNGSTALRCFEATFTVETRYDFGSMNITKGFVMADFRGENETLGIASQEGIRYPNNNIIFDSLTNTLDGNKSSIVYTHPGSGSPVVVLSSATVTKVFRDPSVFTFCGDDECSLFESAFTCPADCGIEGDPSICTVDADCPTNFPSCHASRCVSGFNSSLTCNFNTDCPINSPVCFANACVIGVSGGLNATNPTNDTAVDAVRTAVDTLTTGNPILKMIIGLFILIGIAFGAMQTMSQKGAPVSTGVIALIVTVAFLILTFIGMFPKIIAIVLGVAVVIFLLFERHITAGKNG